MDRKTVLVTGAQGFIGRHLCHHLVQQGFQVRAAVRQRANWLTSTDVEYCETGDLGHFCDWPQLFDRVDTVIHLIARTHIADEFGLAALHEYRQLNVELTRRLAKAAVRHGVERFVFMSSIKAIGNSSTVDFHETTDCVPEDSYGISKLEAEQVILETLVGSGCDYTILRPPLVYGEGVRGNFLRLMQLVQRGVPLPAVSNRRSMVHVQNLVDAAVRCLTSDSSRNQLFHVADPHPISTADLVRSMARGLGRAAVLLPVPRLMLTSFGKLVGKQEETHRLVGSLVVSTAKIIQELGWQPAIHTKEGVAQTCASFLRAPWSDEQLAPATSRRRAA